MYLLKYQENSDTACESQAKPYASRPECLARMKKEYGQAQALLGICDEDLPDPEKDDESGSVSGYMTDDKAYLRRGFDSYQWEIIEDPRFVLADELYIVSGVYHDLENGNIYHCPPVACYGKKQAQRELQIMFEERLAEYELPENGACDEDGDAVPGGCIWDGEATIYCQAEYALDCLVEVASFTAAPIKIAGQLDNKQLHAQGIIVSVWDDNINVSSPCRVNFKTGQVVVTGDNDFQYDDGDLQNLHTQYVTVGGCVYTVIEKKQYAGMVTEGNLTQDGLDEAGNRVLWYE